MTSTRTSACRLISSLLVSALVVGVISHAESAQAQPHSRARLGLQGDIGYVRESNSGLVLGLTGQLGIQQNDLFAVFYQPRLLAGSYLDRSNGVAVAAFYNTAMFDFTFGNLLQLGLGPSLDLGVVGVCRSSNCDGFGGAFFGADFKVALAFGARGPMRQRGGFVLALHVHPTWIQANNPVTTVTLGFGFQVY